MEKIKKIVNENKVTFSTIISILYLGGKGLIAFWGNRYGFILTIIASGLTYYKFKYIDDKEKTNELAKVELGTIIVFIIAFFIYKGKDYQPKFWEQIIIYGIGGLLSLVYIEKTIKSIKNIDLFLQNLAILFFIIGPTLIVDKIGYGWISYMLAHLIMAIIQLRLKEKDYVFSIFQIISFIIAGIGLALFLYNIKL